MDVTKDEVPDDEDSYWATASTGAHVTLIFESSDISDSNEFGIFDPFNPSKRVPIFSGSATTANMATLVILADGTVRVNFIDTGVIFAGNSFGFYLDSRSAHDGGIWYSDTRLNSDGLDHMAAYQGVRDVIQIPGLAKGIWAETEFILAFEDHKEGSADKDYVETYRSIHLLDLTCIKCLNLS